MGSFRSGLVLWDTTDVTAVGVLTDFRGQSYYFAGENVFRLAIYTYLTPYPGFLASIEGREGVWTDGDAPDSYTDVSAIGRHGLRPRGCRDRLRNHHRQDSEESGRGKRVAQCHDA